ncbi:hypothetical protein [Deefgea piscis]|uniref:hypothetical protein n=1 Tax=Deefgea piscis TaxID=2739061 RepID=UPI001C823449|nr:hypothetical protein [Deefgea piscis]QZA80206.1 hypothetical protein K4H25_11750 [Deefgea piscis]
MPSINDDAINRLLAESYRTVPQLPQQITAMQAVVNLCGAGVGSEMGAIGAILQFDDSHHRKTQMMLVPTERIIANLAPNFSEQTLVLWSRALNELHLRYDNSQMSMNDGLPCSPTPDLIQFHWLGQAKGFKPSQMLESWFNTRCGFHLLASKTKAKGGDGNNPALPTSQLIQVLRKRLSGMELIENNEHWHLWRGNGRSVALLHVNPHECSKEQISNAAGILCQIAPDDNKTICVVCDDAETIKAADRFIEQLKIMAVELEASDNPADLML